MGISTLEQGKVRGTRTLLVIKIQLVDKRGKSTLESETDLIHNEMSGDGVEKTTTSLKYSGPTIMTALDTAKHSIARIHFSVLVLELLA